MIHLISGLNWLSIAAGFVAYSIIGALWFTLFFKKPYAVSLGKDPGNLNNSSLIFILGPMACTLVVTITSAILMEALQVRTFGDAIEFAFVIGVGYLVANTVNIAINPNIPRPGLYSILSGTFHLAGIVLVCIIIVSMG